MQNTRTLCKSKKVLNAKVLLKYKKISKKKLYVNIKNNRNIKALCK